MCLGQLKPDRLTTLDPAKKDSTGFARESENWTIWADSDSSVLHVAERLKGNVSLRQKDQECKYCHNHRMGHLVYFEFGKQ